jgi:hypothetical protein
MRPNMNRNCVCLVFVLTLLTSLPLAAQSEGFQSLMPKKDLSEFWTPVGVPPDLWSLQDGVIAAKGMPMGVLRSNKKYKNFVFRGEIRFQKEGWTKAPAEWPNAGFFIFASEEMRERYPHWPQSFVEVQGHYGEIASVFGGKIKGAQRGVIVPPDQHGPLGEWDRIEVTTKNGDVRVMLNGKLVNEGFGADPPVGYICLQSEGWPVFYRNVEIKVLPD